MRLALLLLCMVATVGQAEPWHRGRHGRNRILHVSITAGGGLLYPATGFIEDRWSADACRWCKPTGVDDRVRDALRYDDANLSAAGTASDVGAYVASPALAIGLVLTGTLRDGWSSARVIDDVTPVLETMVIVGWVTRGMKLAIGRQRPYAHFGAASGDDANLSFPSGHTSRAFGLATSAAMIAHVRGYAVEPYLWGGGMAVAVATGYLRIAADRHYLTDVLAGAALGIGAGLTVPYLMHRCEIVPTRDGLAVAGWW